MYVDKYRVHTRYMWIFLGVCGGFRVYVDLGYMWINTWYIGMFFRYLYIYSGYMWIWRGYMWIYVGYVILIFGFWCVVGGGRVWFVCSWWRGVGATSGMWGGKGGWIPRLYWEIEKRGQQFLLGFFNQWWIMNHVWNGCVGFCSTHYSLCILVVLYLFVFPLYNFEIFCECCWYSF